MRLVPISVFSIRAPAAKKTADQGQLLVLIGDCHFPINQKLVDGVLGALGEQFPGKFVHLTAEGEPAGQVKVSGGPDPGVGFTFIAGWARRGGNLVIAGQYSVPVEQGQKRGSYLAALADDGQEAVDLDIVAEVTIKGDTASVDLSGSADQAPGPVNCTLNMSKSAVYCAFLSLADGTVMANSGAYRPIEVMCRAGAIANCRHPAPVANRMATGHRIVTTVLGDPRLEAYFTGYREYRAPIADDREIKEIIDYFDVIAAEEPDVRAVFFADADTGDYFSVDVGTDPIFGTPVFDVRSGRSSNPWEAGTQPRDTGRRERASTGMVEGPCLYRRGSGRGLQNAAQLLVHVLLDLCPSLSTTP